MADCALPKRGHSVRQLLFTLTLMQKRPEGYSSAHCFLEPCHQHRFGDRAFDVNRLVDDGARHALNLVLHRQVREFNRFDHISPNQVALHSQLVSQAHGPGTVRSGRGDKDLHMDRLAQRCYLSLGRLRQPRFALRDHHHVFDQRAEFVARGDAVIADRIIFGLLTTP